MEENEYMRELTLKPETPFIIEQNTDKSWSLAAGTYDIPWRSYLDVKKYGNKKMLSISLFDDYLLGIWSTWHGKYIYSIDIVDLLWQDISELGCFKRGKVFEIKNDYRYEHYAVELLSPSGTTYYLHTRIFMDECLIRVYLLPQDTQLSKHMTFLEFPEPKLDWLSISEKEMPEYMPMCLEALQHIEDWLYDYVPIVVVADNSEFWHKQKYEYNT